MKVDSGPGRTNLSLLTNLRLLGFVLYPCVPITTHITQESNQNYGPFKTQFLHNLEDIADARLKAKQSLSLQPKFVELPLFRRVDWETGYKLKLLTVHSKRDSGRRGVFLHGRRLEQPWRMC